MTLDELILLEATRDKVFAAALDDSIAKKAAHSKEAKYANLNGASWQARDSVRGNDSWTARAGWTARTTRDGKAISSRWGSDTFHGDSFLAEFETRTWRASQLFKDII